MEFRLLKIKDFKGIDELEFAFTDGFNEIRGANGSGKTTVLDALFWVLFGKTSDERTKFSLMPLDENGEEVPGCVPQVSVEMVLGKETYTLERKYTGSSYTQSINEVPYKSREFDVWVTDRICDSGTFKMLINPMFIGDNMSPSEQRALFLSYFKMPKKEDIFGEMEKAGVPPSSEFKKRIEGNAPDKVAEGSKIKIKELERLIDQDDGRLSVYRDSVANFKCDMPKTEIESKVQRLEVEMKEYQKLLDKARRADDERSRIKNDILYAEDKIVHFKDNVKTTIRSMIERKTGKAEDLEERLKELREDYSKLADSKVDKTCPTCKQALPKPTIVEMDMKRDAEMKELVEKGKEKRAELDKLKAEIETLKTKDSLPELDAELNALKKELKDKKSKLENLPSTEPIPPMPDMVGSLSDLKAKLNGYDDNAKAKQTINEIVRLQRLRAVEIEDNRKIADMCSAYETARAEIIVNRVNREFDKIKISLIEKLKNGTLKDTFMITLDGVPYTELNSAGKLQAGMELTQYIANKKELELPMVIDNFERYPDVELPEELQIIACTARMGEVLNLRGE